MSAYIVDKDHILYIVEAAMSPTIQRPYRLGWYWNGNHHELHEGDLQKAAEVANMLWEENVKSVSHRYPSDKIGELPGPNSGVEFIAPSDIHFLDKFDHAQVFKAIDCFEYQSCEADTWEECEAKAFIEALRKSTWSKLPGYEDAEWGAPQKTNKHQVLLSRL